jgi:hypothetical protein
MGAAGFFIRAALGGAALVAGTGGGSALEPSQLYDTCFSRSYAPGDLAAHPGRRVSAMSVAFHAFDQQLLASVIYTLRYGTRFGFSGECLVKVDGGYLCDACANDCATSSEHFTILWSGGDRVTLVNDLTGMLAKNREGGSDYLMAGGGDAEFQLRRGSSKACEW